MTRRQATLLGISAAASIAACSLSIGQDQPKVGFKDTPMLPGGKWHVHDGDRPRPPVITPGTCSTQQEPGQPPSDAIVLFDGKDLSHWKGRRGGPATWNDRRRGMVIKPGAGEITSKEEFGDCQLHLEFAAPVPARGRDQGRGNSGVMFFGRYEIQMLDSFENLTYADGQTAAIYGQYPPLVNASRPPGQWQTYDIIFTAPRFKPDRIAGIAGLRDDAAQRRAGAQPRRGHRRDGLSGRRQVHPARSQRADPLAGPRQPGAIPEYLGPGYVAVARCPLSSVVRCKSCANPRRCRDQVSAATGHAVMDGHGRDTDGRHAAACRKCRKCRSADDGFPPAAGPRIGLDRDVADVANDAASMSYSLALAREVASSAMTQCRKCRKCRNIFANPRIGRICGPTQEPP